MSDVIPRNRSKPEPKAQPKAKPKAKDEPKSFKEKVADLKSKFDEPRVLYKD